MIPFSALLGTQPTATFVTSANTSGSALSGTLTSRGILVGDVMIVISRDPSTPVSSGTGSWTAYPALATGGVGNGRVYSKIATSGDLGGTITLSAGNGFLLSVYRGANSVGQESIVQTTSANPMVVPGFNQNGNTIGLVGCGCLANSSAIAFANPVTWQSRQNQTFGSPLMRVQIYDRLYPTNQVYDNGTNVTVTNASGNAGGAIVLSLRS